MTVEILRYEAKWTPNSEWEECSHNDYLMIRQSIMVEDAPSRCRVIGVVDDSAGLLLPGPKGYGTWREAAVNEKGRRVELEREVNALKIEKERLESICMGAVDRPAPVALQAYVADNFIRKHFCALCSDYTIVDGSCERDGNHAHNS